MIDYEGMKDDYEGMTIEQASARIKEIKKIMDTGKLPENPFELDHLQKHFKLTNSDVNKIVGMDWLSQERQLGDRYLIQALMKKENLTEEEVEKLPTTEINKRLGINKGPFEGKKLK